MLPFFSLKKFGPFDVLILAVKTFGPFDVDFGGKKFGPFVLDFGRKFGPFKVFSQKIYKNRRKCWRFFSLKKFGPFDVLIFVL